MGVLKSRQRPLRQNPGGVGDDVVAKRHGNGDVLRSPGWDNNVPLFHKLGRLILIKPKGSKHHGLGRSEQQSTVDNLLPRWSAQSLQHPCRALNGCVEEGVESTGLASNLTLAVEVNRQVLCQRCGLLLGHSLVSSDLVGRQANGVFHGLVVVGEPIKDWCGYLTSSLQRNLQRPAHSKDLAKGSLGPGRRIKDGLEGFCPLLAAAELISKSSLPTLFLELFPELCPGIVGRLLTFTAQTLLGIDPTKRTTHPGKHSFSIVPQRRRAQLKQRTLNVTGEVDYTEDRVVLSVDLGKVLGEALNVAHRPPKLVCIQIL